MASVLRALADAPGRALLAPGQEVGGKYVVEREVGQGGMGVVYLAQDVRLRRAVALKLGNAVSPAALARAEREGQSIAKLSHPNVVVVYEVGEALGRVFVAMEYVAGGTARTWLAERPRTWRAIVELYAAAGDGLSAAHDAGIVHRDFKPDNVLVGEDGRPRVADFGLARELGEVAPTTGLESPDGEGRASARSQPETDLTAAGAAVGTAPYMSPEQHAALEVDARSDQFAFCAALWEALYGARPFDGRTRDDLLRAIATGSPRVGSRRLPRHVVDALRVGLRVAPERRWPSMRALLTELRRDPGARRRRIAIAALAALSLGGAVAGGAFARRPDPCEGGEARAARVWSPSRAAEVERALTAAGAGAVVPVLRASIDDYQRTWVTAERNACRATRVEGTQSEAILDRRMLCLRLAQAQLDSVLGAVTLRARDVAAKPREVIASLPDLATCSDVDAIGNEPPLPGDPNLRQEIEAIGKELGETRTRMLHNEKSSTETLDRTMASARRVGWAPLIAETSYTRALAALQQGEVARGRVALEESVRGALASGSDRTAAFAMADLAKSFSETGSLDEARRWMQLALAESARLGDPPALGCRIASVEGDVLAMGMHPEAALAARQRQVDLSRRAFHDPMNAVVDHYSLAVGLLEVARYDDASREIAAGLAGATAAYGKDHPVTIDFVLMAGFIAMQRGDLVEAEGHSREALRLAEAWYGTEALQVVNSLQTLGAILLRRGDRAGGGQATARAIAIVERLDPKSTQAGELEANAAEVAAGAGAFEEAESRGARAEAILVPLWGAESPRLVDLLVIRGAVARSLHKPGESEAHLLRAVALADRAGETADPINPRVELSYTLALQHRASEAVRLLEPMLARAAGGKTEPRIVAEYHLAFADALWSSGDRKRAQAEAITSRDAWSVLGADFVPQKKGAEEWLRTHR